MLIIEICNSDDDNGLQSYNGNVIQQLCCALAMLQNESAEQWKWVAIEILRNINAIEMLGIGNSGHLKCRGNVNAWQKTLCDWKC